MRFINVSIGMKYFMLFLLVIYLVYIVRMMLLLNILNVIVIMFIIVLGSICIECCFVSRFFVFVFVMLIMCWFCFGLWLDKYYSNIYLE